MNKIPEPPFKSHKFKWVVILIIPIVVLLVSWIVMLLWNAILPDILPIKAISYKQAVGIFILSKILFGGFRFFRRDKRHPFFMGHLRNKWVNMSEEEKQKFRDEWKRRCDPAESHSAPPENH